MKMVFATEWGMYNVFHVFAPQNSYPEGEADVFEKTALEGSRRSVTGRKTPMVKVRFRMQSQYVTFMNTRFRKIESHLISFKAETLKHKFTLSL